jgi:hypothetical protein
MVVATTVFATSSPAMASTPTSAASKGVVPFASATVHPRVTCGYFDGTVSWDHQDVSLSGILGETCGGRTWVHVAWNDPFHNDFTVPNWVSGGRTNIDWRSGATLSPSNISFYVCNITNGVRRCGSAWHV